MKARLPKTVTVTVLATSLMAAVSSARPDDTLKADSQQALQNFKQKDPTLEQVLSQSAGYAVFPSIGEGGLIVGGAHGKGIVYQNGKAIGQATTTRASIGAQVGGQSFAELIIFQTPEALSQFKSGKFEMSAEVSGVVASSGAAQTAAYSQGVAVFTLPKSGVMGKAAVGGQKFKFEPLE